MQQLAKLELGVMSGNKAYIPNKIEVLAWDNKLIGNEYVDSIGTRDPVSKIGGYYLSAGTISTGLAETALSYTDATTLLSVDDITDASGDFEVPVNGMVDLTIDGHYFPLEESTGGYIGATDGTYYAITTVTWVQSDGVPSYADENGYTPSDGSTMYWDVDTTIPIVSGVNITAGAGFIGDPLPIPEYLFKPNGTNNVVIRNDYVYSQTEDIIIEFNVKGTTGSDRKLYSEIDTTGAGAGLAYFIGSGSIDSTKFKAFIRTKGYTTLLASSESTLPVFDNIAHECRYKDIAGVVSITIDGVEEVIGTYTRAPLATMGINGSALFSQSASSGFIGAGISRIKAGNVEWLLNEGTGNTIYDTLSNSYTINGTVLENQWIEL